MVQIPLPAAATTGTLELSVGERVLLLRMLDQSAPKNFEAVRQYSAAHETLMAGITTFALSELAKDLDLTSDAAAAPSSVEGVSRSAARTLIDIVRSTLDRGQTPGAFARVMLHAYDQLSLFVSES